MRKFDIDVVHEIAAEIFWRMAAGAGIGEATHLVLSTGGEVLFQQVGSVRVVNKTVSKLRANSGDGWDFQDLISRVKSECVALLGCGEPPLGEISSADALKFIGSGAQFVNPRSLDIQPSKVVVRGDFDELGSLCIRHPLPAVCFATRPSRKSIVKIAETKRALAFNIFKVSLEFCW